jgi:DNA-binding NtrC family response regulator
LKPARDRVDINYVAQTSVLVVDDDRDSRRILRCWMKHWGMKVREAANASEALEEMAAHPADVAFLDIVLPGHSGLWLAERIRERWPRTAIVMASCMGDMQTVLRAKRMGAIDYLVKPFGRELLHQAVERAIAESSHAA